MDLILDLALTPTAGAKLTPLEILRDFAYASPSWHYLEDASRHYAEEKGGAACILRHHVLDGSTDVDIAFAQRSGSEEALYLTIVQPGDDDPAQAGRAFDADQRQEIARHFLEHLQAHLDRQSTPHAEVHVERGTAAEDA